MSTDDSTRLNKYLALQLGLSRREADDYIRSGRVIVNGQTAELGSRVLGSDNLEVDGKNVSSGAVISYLALNKPVGYVCSRKQQGSSPTIYDLLPKDYHHLKPVGRLDRDSSGIILLTNDGDFAFNMTHPKFAKTKIYNVCLDRDLAPLHQQMIADYGINLADGKSLLQLERLNETDSKNWIVTMTEGRNRQIRRTFESLGYKVSTLHRTNFGNYALGDIKPGEYETVNIR